MEAGASLNRMELALETDEATAKLSVVVDASWSADRK
jgi:hypothetical protein